MKETDYRQLERLISSNRLSTYRTLPQTTSHHQLIAAYLWNTQLSETFYLLLQNLEVGLRNAIYEAFNAHFPSQPFFFLYETDKDKRYIKRREYHSYGCWKMIAKVQSNLVGQGIALSDGKIIAELNFGFWTTLLKEKHYRNKMWRSIFSTTFPYYPFSHSIDNDVKTIAAKIDRIRIFRNRIFHYEPIFNHTDLFQMHADILEIIGWFSPDLQKLCMAFDEFDRVVRSRGRINKKVRSLYGVSMRRKLKSKARKR